MSWCKRTARFTAAPLVALIVALVATGCSSKTPPECCPCQPAAEGRRALDEQLMALLGAARAYHHQADLLLRQGKRAEAIAALGELLALDLDSKWPEAEEVRLDAASRLAKLLVEEGKLDEAIAKVEAQLATSPRESFYLANLHAVRGEILEARVKRLDGDGQKEKARDVAREAIGAFERSIEINKRLQRAMLKAKPAAPATGRDRPTDPQADGGKRR